MTCYLFQFDSKYPQYLGTWYEIFVFPTTFEKGSCTRAVYTRKDDGHISVYNRGIDNGTEVKVIGDAYRPDDAEQGRKPIQYYNCIL